ncbi:MAG: type II toxin-antitoxin system HicA family toxin [Thermotogae bacterium]|nr:MAG: type II toxin-antitoxin system HicA family toxin [Thermotogota bacterium]
MSKLPRLTAKEIIRILESQGFILTRSSGSHRIYKNSEGKRVTVPFHSGKVLHPKLLKSIIRDMGLTEEEFLKLLNK